MRRFGVRLAVVLIVVGGAGLAYARLNGPPASRTGAVSAGGAPAELTCTACHYSYPLNDPAGSLTILDLPASYVPGQTYSVRLRLEFARQTAPPDSVQWGFQFTAVRADSGTGAGSFVVPPSLQIVSGNNTFASRRYVEHTRFAAHTGESGPVEWTFSWTAPPRAVDKIYFFATGNAADGNGSSSGDNIFTAIDSLLPEGSVSVSDRGLGGLRAGLEAPVPNPSRAGVHLRFSLATPGQVDLVILDAQGRLTRTLLRESSPAGPGQILWDGRDDRGAPVPNGTYLAKLRVTGVASVRKVTLQR